MKEFNCIGCPRGCLLHVEEENGEFTVTGNSCDNGRKFAISEMTEPTRQAEISYAVFCLKKKIER